MSEMVRRKSGDRPAKEIASAFRPGVMTVVTLGNPREKFWGRVLSLTLEGLSISGVDLPSMEDVATMVKNGEPFTPAVVFFPMHRVERVEVDGPEGGLPSLTERFVARTGVYPSTLFAAGVRRKDLA